MSRSNDAGHFFQTSSALATSERKAAKAKNKHGDPIRRPSKILAVTAADHFGSAAGGDATRIAVFTAEAAGDVTLVELKDEKKVTKILTEATAPLTCLAIDAANGVLFAGCWDKKIYCSALPSKRPGPGSGNGESGAVSNSTSTSTAAPPVVTLSGHTDFVKCLLHTNLDETPVLISGGADAAIIVWVLDTDSTTTNGANNPASSSRMKYKQLHKLKGHTKALQALAIDPLSLPSDSPATDSFTLFTASSDREIRRWHVSLGAAHELPESLSAPIRAHETSVYALRFDGGGDLWTASADKTAKRLVRERGWASDTELAHPDFVRDVVVCEGLGVVVTACRDEEVRVWDVASGELRAVYGGHFEEVTGLCLVGDGGRSVVSVSIDGTIRRWGLEKGEIERYLEEIERERSGKDGGEEDKGGEGMLTAEEEAELADLMDDDD